MSTNQLDIGQLVRDAVKGKRSTGTSDRYFMVKVAKVAESQQQPGLFRVSGQKVETGTPVVVFAKKSSSGQNVPEVGGLFRADKAVMRRGETKVDVYDAEYFHAYPAADYCMKAVASPSLPRFNETAKMWGAKVDLVDTEINATSVTALDISSPQGLAKAIFKGLTPWSEQNQSSINGDLKGDSIWKRPMPGACPFVNIRVQDVNVRVWGLSAEKGQDGQYRWPSNEKIMQRVMDNISRTRSLTALVEALGNVAKSHPDELKRTPAAIIPGVSINVGRSSLNGQAENYLPTPELFRYPNDRRQTPSDPEKFSGWRESYIHLKASEKRIFVVNMVPVGGNFMDKKIPLTAVERELAEKAENLEALQSQQPAQQSQEQAPQQAQQAPQAQASQQQAPQQQTQKPAAVQNSSQNSEAGFDDNFADDFADSMGDFENYADDLAAMEAMNSTPAAEQDFEDDDFDDLIAQAEQKVKTRYAPKM